MRVLVVGDICGHYSKLMSALENAAFSDEDILIQLGNLTGTGKENIKVLDFFLSVPNKILIKGNTDLWLYQFLKYRVKNQEWLKVGGFNIIAEYDYEYSKELNDSHAGLLELQLDYFEFNNCLFVHAGMYDNMKAIDDDKNIMNPVYYAWDTNFWMDTKLMAKNEQMPREMFGIWSHYDYIFIGHHLHGFKPRQYLNVFNVYTAPDRAGKIAVMDVETKQYWKNE